MKWLSLLLWMAVSCGGPPDPTTLAVTGYDLDELPEELKHPEPEPYRVALLTPSENQINKYAEETKENQDNQKPKSQDHRIWFRGQLGQLLLSMGMITLVEQARLSEVIEQIALNLEAVELKGEQAQDVGQLLEADYLVLHAMDEVVLQIDKLTPSLWEQAFLVLLEIFAAMNDVELDGMKAAPRYRGIATVQVEVKVLSVKSGQVLRQESLKGRAENIARSRGAIDQEALKQKALEEAIEEIRLPLVSSFPLVSTVTELKGQKEIAKIAMGSNQGVETGRMFSVFLPQTTLDEEDGQLRVEQIYLGEGEAYGVATDFCWLRLDRKAQEGVKKGCMVKSDRRPADSGFWSELFD